MSDLNANTNRNQNENEREITIYHNKPIAEKLTELAEKIKENPKLPEKDIPELFKIPEKHWSYTLYNLKEQKPNEPITSKKTQYFLPTGFHLQESLDPLKNRIIGPNKQPVALITKADSPVIQYNGTELPLTHSSMIPQIPGIPKNSTAAELVQQYIEATLYQRPYTPYPNKIKEAKQQGPIPMYIGNGEYAYIPKEQNTINTAKVLPEGFTKHVFKGTVESLFAHYYDEKVPYTPNPLFFGNEKQIAQDIRNGTIPFAQIVNTASLTALESIKQQKKQTNTQSNETKKGAHR